MPAKGVQAAMRELDKQHRGKKQKRAAAESPNTPGPSGPAAQSASGLQQPSAWTAPELTESLAGVFAKLLYVGCPPADAVGYVLPGIPFDHVRAVTAAWTASVLVREAFAKLIGGEWINLPKEERMRLVMEKSDAEMAFYLWANNFNTIEHKEGLTKIEMARKRMREIVEGKTDDEDDPMAAMGRFMLDVVRNQVAAKTAQKAQPQTMMNQSMLDEMAKEFEQLDPEKSQKQ